MTDKQIIKILSPYLTEERLEKLKTTASSRSKSVVTVLENPYDRGNINAAMRSAEAFGFQDFHIIEGPSKLKPAGRTSAGAGKWLSVHRWQKTKECFHELKKSGFVILGTSGEATKSIYEVDLSQKSALVFGSEHAGLSPEADELVDEHIKIPTVGMVESFNLSVAVALSLQTAFLAQDLEKTKLTDSEYSALLAEFMIKSVPNAKKILDKAL